MALLVGPATLDASLYLEQAQHYRWVGTSLKAVSDPTFAPSQWSSGGPGSGMPAAPLIDGNSIPPFVNFPADYYAAAVQLAINAVVVSAGAERVFIPSSIAGYNKNLIVNPNNVPLVLESQLYSGIGPVVVVGSTTALSSIAAAVAALGGAGTVIVPDGYSETITVPIVVSSATGMKIEVMPKATLTIGGGGSITLINNGVWEQLGGTINVTKNSGDAVLISGGWSRFIVAQLNYTGGAGTTNGLVFAGAQFSRADVGQIKNFGGTGLLIGRSGAGQGTLNNRVIVEFINNCASLCTFASGVSGTDASPFCEGNRVYANLASAFTVAGLTFGDNGTLHDCEFNEFRGDVHDTSGGGIVPIIFNDGQYCYFDGSVFTDHGTVRATFNANAKFNMFRAANLGTSANVNGVGLFQNTLLSENLIQAVSINSSTWSPIILGNNASLQGYSADNVTLAAITKIRTDNHIQVGDSSRNIYLATAPNFLVQVDGITQIFNRVGIGVAVGAAGLLVQYGQNISLVGQTSQAGIQVDWASDSSATASIRGIQVRAQTQAASFTCGQLSCLYVQNPVKGAGSTITAAYGILVENITAGSANRAIQTGTGLVILGDAVQITASVNDGAQNLVSGATPALNAATGDYFMLNITSNIAEVIAVPTGSPDSTHSQDLFVAIRNSSGGALTTAPTFNTGAGGFKFSGASIVNPANGTQVIYHWRWDPAQSFYYLVAVSLAL